MATGLGLRITRLRALIDHPATGDGERSAAQRMLDRLLPEAGRSVVGDRVYGGRYGHAGRHASLPRIVELIDADIAFARTFTRPGSAAEVAVYSPLRDAPAEVTYAVDSPSDGTIVITIEAVPAGWGWDREDGVETVSPALQALADELAEIMNRYNRDGSDVGKRFFGTVRAQGVTLVW
ncbi:hypothetical protein [Prescottella defluvii]|uniref:hypothetical protein n=1 Tax=Prescottella defluvii TaxID=1323361 RepID=UPI0004F319A6|nr:hypothetical protein [Prescottella defluvii]